MQKHLSRLEQIVKYLVASLLLVIPLYPKFPFIKVPNTFVSIRIEDFLLLVIAIVILPLLIINIKDIFKNKIIIAIIIYLSVGFASLLSAIFITKTVLLNIVFLHWIRRIEYFIPFFLGLGALKRKSNLEFFIKILMITVFIMTIYGLGQRYLDWPIIVTQNQEYSKGIALRYVEGGHINSTFAGHYDLSSFLVMVLPILICTLSLLFAKNKYSKTNFFLCLTILGGLWLLSVSGSRISTFSYLVATTIAIILIKKLKYIPFFILLSLIIFISSPGLRARYIRILDVITKKITMTNLIYTQEKPLMVKEIFADQPTDNLPKRRDLISPSPMPVVVFEDRSTNIRLNVEWPRALRAFVKNPFLGTGYSSITLATDNDYLRLLGEVGIIGFLAFLTILLRLAISIKRIIKLNKLNDIQLAFTSGVIGSVTGILINAFFIDIFEASKFAIIFWLFIGILVSMDYIPNITRTNDNE